MIVNPGSTDVTTYFVMRLAASGVEATGLTITDFDLQYTRSGAAPSAKVDATALAATDSAHGDNQAIEIDSTDQPGLYRVDWPDAAFAAGVREVILSVKCATAFTEHLRVELAPAVNVELWNGTAVPAEHTAGYPVVTVKDGTGTGEINTNAGKVVGVELVDTLTTYTGNTVQTGDSFARLGAPAGASVSADILAIDNLVDDLESRVGTPSNLGGGATLAANLADIEAQTDDIGAAGAGLTAVPWNAAWDAEVQSEVDDALVVHRLDELLNADSDIDGAAPPTVGSVFHELMTKTTGSFTFDQTTDSLEALRDRGDAAWTTATGFSTHSAADVWAVATRTLTAGTNINGSTFTSIPWNAAWDAEVQSEVQDAIEVNHLDHLLAVAADGTECANSTYWARLVSKSATPAFSSYVNTTDSLEAIRDRGDAAWTTGAGLSASEIRDAVGLASANLDTQLDALPTATENADALLKRDWSSVTGESARSVLNALRKLRNEWSISGSTLTVKKEDDSTTAYTQTLTSGSADPITAIDN